MTTETNQRFNLAAPPVTVLEAETLFYWHLKMAAILFEVIPEGIEFNSQGLDSPTADAAEAFYSSLTEWYKDNS